MASAKEVAALFELDGPARYGHMIRRIADFEEAWSLRSDDGWSALGDAAFPTPAVRGESSFPPSVCVRTC